MKTVAKPDYVKIISEYKGGRGLDPWVEYCSSQASFNETIMAAALAIDANSKKNKHQWRLSNDLLAQFGESLCGHASDLKKVSSFKELLRTVEKYKLRGIGPLACYDTATRIGARLGIYPEKIYLHAGTRVGAELILGHRIRGKYIDRKMLPEAFQSENLTNDEIENILCVCRHHFGNPGNSRKRSGKC